MLRGMVPGRCARNPTVHYALAALPSESLAKRGKEYLAIIAFASVESRSPKEAGVYISAYTMYLDDVTDFAEG